jgi:EmrB/QacA subfamily drug resistance transporter
MPRITDKNRRWWILITMTGCLSMILIDQTVVSVALPSIQRDLDASQTGLQWVVNAYLLALAALVAVGGRLGDMFGNGRMFKLGVAVFIAASAACGLAQSETWIVVARAVQGAGAALMVPATGAIVINAFAPEERGRAMGIYAGISMIFLAIGPLVGGLLTEGITWRAVFYINLPIGIGMLVLAAVTLPRDTPEGGAIDWPGLLTLVGGLTALVLALMQSQDWGWGSPATIGLLVAAAILLPLFCIIEPRVRNRLIELRLFASRNFTVDNIVLAAVEFSLTGLTVFGAIYVQNVLDFSPIGAGLSLLPLTVPLLVLAPLAGRIYDRAGPRGLVGGGVLLVGLGLMWNAALLDEQDYAVLVPGYLLMGVGLALVMSPASTDVMNAAPAALRGEASGVMQTMRQVGGTVGLALMATIVAHIQSDKIESYLESQGESAAQAAQLEGILSEGGDAQSAATSQISPDVLNEAQDALVSGIGTAYWVGGAVMVVAAVVALLLLRRVEAVDAPAIDPKPAHPAHAPVSPAASA